MTRHGDTSHRTREGYCDGVCTSTYRKGQACCSKPKYRTPDLKEWCQLHVPMTSAAKLIKDKKT